MKKLNFFAFLALVIMSLSSCGEAGYVSTMVTFEDVTLKDSIWNGSDGSGNFQSAGISFKNDYNSSWFTWSGFACSSKKDKVTTGWANQYSAITGAGASSSAQYAVAYDSASVVCNADKINGAFYARSVMLTNDTYTYYDMVNGSDYSKKFVSGDWFKVIVTGYLNNTVTGSAEFYLADFRNGKSLLVNSWKKLDISSLGQIDRLSFTFGSSDTGSWGINTPKYVCVDNLDLRQKEATE